MNDSTPPQSADGGCNSQRSNDFSPSLGQSGSSSTAFTQMMENGQSSGSGDSLNSTDMQGDASDIASSNNGIMQAGSNLHPRAQYPGISEASPGGDMDTTTGTSQAGWDTDTRRQLLKLSPIHRNVLKCCIAYFIASLFTFCPRLSSLMSDLISYGADAGRPTPSGHMVATIAVYYNPAKTVGGMIEADIFCAFGLLYSSVVCLSSMSLFWWLELKPGWEWLGDVVAIVWIGISMGAVAWMKAWMNCPSFNTACSMTAIIVFVVLVKEGGMITLLQVSTIVVCGSIVSNLICFIFWPQTATITLEKDISRTLESFLTLFSRLTDIFLLENGYDPAHTMQERLHKAIEDHQGSFTTLNRNLNEARSERSYSLWMDYEAVVATMNRLAQHLNGLRSSTRLHYELTQAGIVRSRAKYHENRGRDNSVDEGNQPAIMPSAIFKELMEDLSRPLRTLKVSCVHALRHLYMVSERLSAEGDNTRQVNFQEFAELVEAIERALVDFDNTSERALLRLYRNVGSISQPCHIDSGWMDSQLHGVPQWKQNEEQKQASILQSYEVIFLVYFFVFSLQEFSRELILLIECIERIYVQTRLRHHRWLLLHAGITLVKKVCEAKRPNNNEQRPTFRRNFSHVISMNRRHRPSFPKIHPHAPDTVQTPSWNQLSKVGQLKKLLWTLGKKLVEQRSKYAIKAGMATALLASPAFFEDTRPLFTEYWGDWALISCFVVFSPTIGATNHLSVHRIAGTLFGAAVAATIFKLFPNCPIVLSSFGFVFSMPCFYYALSKPQYASASRFVLLTYNLTCLYCYNQRQKDVDVLDIAFRRAFAVTVGVLWAAIISRLLWPAEARRELSKALGEFCLNLSWLYTRLAASNSYAYVSISKMPKTDTEPGTDVSPIPEGILRESIKEFMAMELHLQVRLIEMQGLLAQAQHEPRLKGPFPVQLYRDVLASLQSILDKFHSMRCVTTREEWCTPAMRDSVTPVTKERREMVGNIILGLSILASAFHLKAPLPPYLPPYEESRKRLVKAICKLEIVRNTDVQGSKQLLFFAYALTMKGVTEELGKLGGMLQSAFGVIGQTPEAFEGIFAYQGNIA